MIYRWVVLLAFVVACARSEIPSAPDDGDNGPTDTQLQVEHVGAWNSYLQFDAATPVWSSTQSCAGETYRDCFHAGEAHWVRYDGIQVCDGSTARDTLELYDWQCVMVGDVAYFSTRRLREGRGLRDLIDPATIAWRPNAVHIDGPVPTSTTTEAWWNNAVVPLPDDELSTLSSAGTVYVVSQSRTVGGVIITADGASLVTMPGALLTTTSNPSASCTTVAQETGEELTRACLIGVRDADRVWLEIAATSAGATSDVITLGLANSDNSRIYASQLEGNGTTTLSMHDIRASRAADLELTRGNLRLTNATGNLAHNVAIAFGNLDLRSADNNAIDELWTSNGYAGINVGYGSSFNTFSRVLAVNHSDYGVQLYGSSSTGNVFTHMTSGNTFENGIGGWLGPRSSANNLVILNTSDHGMNINSSNWTFSNLVVADTSNSALCMSTGSLNDRFSGRLLFSGNANSPCISTVADQGLTSDCVSNGLSDAPNIIIDDQDVALAFTGWVTTDDSSNSSDVNGAATYPGEDAAFDVFGSTPWRTWIRGPGTGYPGSASRGHPPTTGTTEVRLWDWSLKADDTRLRATILGADTPALIVDGAACPNGLDGNTVARDLTGGEVAGDAIGNDDGICNVGEQCDGNTYIRAAFEIVDDDRGDDDGLCESNEACVYAPNAGAYQGHGDMRARSCVFSDGIVSGVQMFGFDANGF